MFSIRTYVTHDFKHWKICLLIKW